MTRFHHSGLMTRTGIAIGAVLMATAAACGQQPVTPATEPGARSASSVRLPFELVQVSDKATGDAREIRPVAADYEPIPLEQTRGASGGAEGSGRASTTQAVTTVATSLAVVLGLFALIVWFSRRVSAGGRASLLGDVVQTLARAPLNAKQDLHLVRVGNKLLLLSVTATTAETLTEITDPAEIQRLTEACQPGRGGENVSASFRDVLHQLSRSPHTDRFTGGGHL